MVSNRCQVKEIPKHLKCIAPEDIFTYSIDESFLDVTPYLNLYNIAARELAKTIIDNVRKKAGTVSTSCIGTNLYLAKIPKVKQLLVVFLNNGGTIFIASHRYKDIEQLCNKVYIMENGGILEYIEH